MRGRETEPVGSVDLETGVDEEPRPVAGRSADGVAHGQHDGEAPRGLITRSAVQDQLVRPVPLLPVQLAQELEPAGDAGLGGHTIAPRVGTAG